MNTKDFISWATSEGRRLDESADGFQSYETVINVGLHAHAIRVR